MVREDLGLDLALPQNPISVVDNMKDQIVAKLAMQCEELYGECLKAFQRENIKSLVDKEWISVVRK